MTTLVAGMTTKTTLLVLVGVCGCGGGQEPPPAVPEPEPEVEGPPPDDGVRIEGIMGSYGRDVVQSLQNDRQADMLGCYAQAISGLPYAYGRISIGIKVSAQGRPIWAYPKETDLGHRGAEKCMVDRVLQARFPRPQGNAEAELGFSYEFAPAGRAASPAEADRLGDVVQTNRAEIDACTGGQGGFVVTLYADREGRVTSAGVSIPDADSSAAADCVTEAVMRWTLPPAGSWFSKVSFAL